MNPLDICFFVSFALFFFISFPRAWKRAGRKCHCDGWPQHALWMYLLHEPPPKSCSQNNTVFEPEWPRVCSQLVILSFHSSFMLLYLKCCLAPGSGSSAVNVHWWTVYIWSYQLQWSLLLVAGIIPREPLRHVSSAVVAHVWSDAEDQKAVHSGFLVGRIEASRWFGRWEFNTKIKFFLFPLFQKPQKRQISCSILLLSCVEYSGFLWWVGGEGGSRVWSKGRICSQVVRDLPFIDSIFGGILKGFRKGRSVMKLLKNKKIS